MKKLDLHIHTVATPSDPTFIFSMDTLKKYISCRDIDAIAITNHNIFDFSQYREIVAALPDSIVFPGIEINIGNNGGHLIVIAKIDEVEEFAHKCKSIESEIKTPKDHITVEQLKNIFANLDRYLLIPHYDKKPPVNKVVLEQLKEELVCGEVNSIKKFIYCQKDSDSLTPVYFSDFRAKEDPDIMPIRQTYFDIDEISIDAIKRCLTDKGKVSLTEKEGHQRFVALPKLELSTGLNVIIGERSSGKTYTLKQIDKYFDNVKYIKQFALLETDPEKADKEFTEKIAIKQSGLAKDYFDLFIRVVDDVKNISLENDERKLEKYLTSLQSHAQETEREDLFSNCRFYSENEYEINDLANLKKLIEAVDMLLSSTQYRELIEKNVSRNNLIKLYKSLIEEHIKEQELVLKKLWINNVIGGIKKKLQSNTAAIRVEDANFYGIQLNRMKIKKFEEIVNDIKKEKKIYSKEIEGFTIEVKTKPYSGASSLKNHSKKQIAFSEAFSEYGNPYNFLQKLKDIEKLEDTSYYEYFADVEYKILNQFGFEVSGGERAEFNLLQEINDAYQYDMLMVDEPESSFDNIFLKNKVNHMLKEISGVMPVVIVTHNSTVGASIKPDFLVHTKRFINEDKMVTYDIFYGSPTSKYLENKSGEQIRNIQATLDCLEAGEAAYLERGKEYEMLRD